MSTINQTIRGSITPPNATASGTTTVTIASVIVAKSQLRHLSTQGMSSYAELYLDLTNTTTITQTRRLGVPGGNALDLVSNYELTEWT